MAEYERSAKSKKRGVASNGNRRARGDEAESSSEETDVPAQEEIVEGSSRQSFESASIASTLSSGISDAGFLYKRLKVFM